MLFADRTFYTGCCSAFCRFNLMLTNLRANSVLVFLLFSIVPSAQPATRLKELVSIEGVRENQLLGYGIVVGLAGTGDRKQTVFPVQSLANLLQRMGVSVPATAITVKNTAAVMVTATLPPYAQPGTHLDVTVAAMGDAPNLQGGLLVLTSLRAANGEVYAIAQGAVVTGGFAVGKQGTGATVNHPTVGRIPDGGSIERGAPSINIASHLNLQLHDADFTTASRVAEVINKHFAPEKGGVAHAQNSALVSVLLPASFSGRAVDFLAELEVLGVDVDRVAKIVVNERTGTIILGKEVHISPVAILHGNLSIEIQTTALVSQPSPLSNGTTTVVPETTLAVKDEKVKNIVLKQGATVEELVRSLTAIGSTARDVISILQSLKAAGALEAELEVI
jgi:flagellar P-ring protein precursor FlgI